MSEWAMPELAVGDLVLYYANPVNPRDPALGFVVEKPGRTALSILVFGQSTGWIEKKSVRHVDDPFWKESETANAWAKWGCYTLHPMTKLMPQLNDMVTDWKVAKARSKTKSTGNK